MREDEREVASHAAPKGNWWSKLHTDEKIGAIGWLIFAIYVFWTVF